MHQDRKNLKPLILYKLKKYVGYHLASVKDNDLAQAFVQAYCALLGNDISSVVVVLTDVGVSHYFKLTPEAARPPPRPPPTGS